MSEAVLQSIEIAAQGGIRKVFIDNLHSFVVMQRKP